MMRVAVFAVFAVFALACDTPVAHPNDQWPIAPSELASTKPRDPGLVIYNRICIACHGADGSGNGAKTGASFIAPDGPLQQTDAQLLASVLDGKTGLIGVMPAHRALLSEDDAKAVLDFIRRTYGGGSKPK